VVPLFEMELPNRELTRKSAGKDEDCVTDVVPDTKGVKDKPVFVAADDDWVAVELIADENDPPSNEAIDAEDDEVEVCDIPP
jgi:hypothetical protein